LADEDRADSTHCEHLSQTASYRGKPGCLALDMPLSTLLRPITAVTDGAQTSATPQRKRFFFSSSNWRLRF
jgi:hypothetical protein